MKVAVYLRVSKDEQTLENQRLVLQEVARLRGWDIVAEYTDHGISGTKGREARPGYRRMLRDAGYKSFDLIAVWSVDRLSRSSLELHHFLAELHGYDVGLYIHQQQLDTSTPAGKALFQMMGVFAELERAMIVERVRAGMDRARSEGKRIGRARVGQEIEDEIRSELAKGTGICKTARLVGVGVKTVQRVKHGDKPSGRLVYTVIKGAGLLG